MNNNQADLIDILKTCTKCGMPKSVSEFRAKRNACKSCESIYNKALKKTPEYRDRENARRRGNPKHRETENSRRRNSPTYKENHKAYEKKRYQGDPEARERQCARQSTPENRERQRIQNRKRKYGLTPEIEAEILKKQHHRCAGCKRKFSDEVRLHRDHDHALGHFRGFLCDACNHIVGKAESTGDPIGTLVRLAERIQENDLFYTAHPKAVPDVAA